MNAHAAEFRRCLVGNGDVAALRALWAHAFPHLEQAGDDEQAWTMLHRARTPRSQGRAVLSCAPIRTDWFEDNARSIRPPLTN